MNNFNFYNPTRVIFGEGMLEVLGQEAVKYGSNAMVVSYQDLGVLEETVKKVEALLTDAGIKVTEYYEISPNPLVYHVEKGVELARAKGIDLVVGIGGGSAMDSAKLIAAGVDYEHKIWKMIVSRHDKEVAIPPNSSLPTIMIPTLPATSSEMNWGAVLTNEKTQEKSYVFSEVLFPKVSIMDPSLTITLPAKQTALGVADAISHAMETYLNTDDESPIQQRMAEGVISTLMDEGRKVLADLTDINHRSIVQWTAAIAWNGWTNTGADHGNPMHHIGHVISAYNNTPHGATLSIIMPAWMRFTYKLNIRRYVEMAENIFKINIHGRDEEDIAIEAIDTFEQYLIEIGVPVRLSEVGIGEESIGMFTKKVLEVSGQENGSLISRHFIDRDAIYNIFKLAL
ncbi:MAG: iron-containing alcohol dehydrogenase [Spirochaetales bacterium]|uniref:Iron-containing alcohol dehydrogenase n=1 Tax=Candidatus Thalassospirochaeta sargassi TaxID=3119039 RepID=A0AAJ1MKI8_9SPIO|nr:iron-containing alcohol dehydrogenase [Spirochaetales bacterium]